MVAKIWAQKKSEMMEPSAPEPPLPRGVSEPMEVEVDSDDAAALLGGRASAAHSDMQVRQPPSPSTSSDSDRSSAISSELSEGEQRQSRDVREQRDSTSAHALSSSEGAPPSLHESISHRHEHPNHASHDALPPITVAAVAERFADMFKIPEESGPMEVRQPVLAPSVTKEIDKDGCT